jgi:DNA-binding transcriptional regulator YiaG
MSGWTPEKVKDLRLRLGKTQKEFAEMLGVHVVTIIRWEKGNFNPSKMALNLLDTYQGS